MEEGYSFIWNANEAPYLKTTIGACISLRLERNIPYLDTREDPDDSPLSKDAALPVAVDDDAATLDDVGPNFDSDDEELQEAVIVGEAAGDADVKDEEKANEEPKVTSRLKEEAKSTVHQLIHIPKNPFCDACQRGKMRERYSRRGAFKHTLEKWGEIITFDYLYSGSQRTVGLQAEKECLVIEDMFTGILHAFPMDSRSTGRVVESVKFSTGRRKIQQIHSDSNTPVERGT